jgi:hypothetical protein
MPQNGTISVGMMPLLKLTVVLEPSPAGKCS